MNLMEALIQSKLGLGGGGSVTPASIVTATGQMTSQQAADTLDNIGGEPKKLFVNVTNSGGVYSADKTFTEINNADVAGKIIECYYAGNAYTEYWRETYDNLRFISFDYDDGIITVYLLRISITDEEITLDEYRFTPAPATVADLSSTSITLAAAANTYYTYGELTDLTVSSFPASGTFWIVFESGATATTVTGIDNFTPEANKRYKLTVENGYASFEAWTIGGGS